MISAVFATHMVRYPLGGNLSWAIQYILGLQRAGCNLTIVERADYPNACFDPIANRITDDPAAGLKIVGDLLDRFGLRDRFVFVDYAGRFHGLEEITVRQRFKEADCFIDSGNHGAWRDLAADVPRRVLIDGEPGFTQIRSILDPSRAALLDEYNFHFTNGLLLGTDRTLTPDTGHDWRPFVNPVCPDLFQEVPSPPPNSRWSTVMNWKAHDPLEFCGKLYGQKNMSFELFESLPCVSGRTMEIAVSGEVPRERLRQFGWIIVDAKKMTQSVDRYHAYIRDSLGEFSVAKHVFVAARTGWFSDRSAAYLASGRPVILQDTGFSDALPTGDGLFGVTDMEEARAAMESIGDDYQHHSDAARDIARKYLDAKIVMRDLLEVV